MLQIWFKTFLGDKLLDSRVFEWPGQPCLAQIAQQTGNAFDYPAPVILHKHEKEFSEFNLARFSCQDFIESVPFDRMELECIPVEESPPA